MPSVSVLLRFLRARECNSDKVDLFFSFLKDTQDGSSLKLFSVMMTHYKHVNFCFMLNYAKTLEGAK